MRISDSRYTKDTRRYELAYRLLRLAARTHTITQWTGLSGYRVRTLNQEYPVESFGVEGRHRGVPPYRLETFSRRRSAKRETVTLAGLFQQVDLIPSAPVPDAAEKFPSLRRGEMLCRAYETFRRLLPQAELTIDHAALLAVSLAQAEEICLGRCSVCDGVMVVDRLSLRSPRCVYCDEEEAHHTAPAAPRTATVSPVDGGTARDADPEAADGR